MRSRIIFTISLFFLAGLFRCAALTDYYKTAESLILGQSLSGTARIRSCIHRASGFKTILTLEITDVSHVKLQYPITLQIVLRQKCLLQIDDIIKFRNLYVPPTKNTYHLHKRSINGVAHLQKLSYILLKRPSWSIMRYYTAQKATLATRIKRVLSARAYALFATLFLGKSDYGYATNELRRSARYWGITHYLARSGLHVMVLLGVWAFCLRLLMIPWPLQQAMILTLLGVYYSFSWTSISFSRAVLIFLFYKICNIAGRSYDPLHLLCITLLILLFLQPLHLFALDFQLSFGLTYVLGIYRKILHQRKIIQSESTKD